MFHRFAKDDSLRQFSNSNPYLCRPFIQPGGVVAPVKEMKYGLLLRIFLKLMKKEFYEKNISATSPS
jgi:hypothetical protein